MDIILNEPLYQWDTGRVIELAPDDGETIDEVHFSNVYCKEAMVVKPKGNHADIPNILLQRNASINVHVVVIMNDGKRTVFAKKLSAVIGRPKPSDYVYQETEILRYEDLEKRIKFLEDNGGVADLSGYLKKEELDTAIDSALKQAKESGAFDGRDGKDGTSVTITNTQESTVDGENNIVTFNDGTVLKIKNGKTGERGEQGVPGTNGKSAYEYAKDSGFSGTESELSQKLATTLSKNEITNLINTQLGVVENGTY